PAFAHWGSHTWPDSLDVMGWSVQDDGLGVIFSRDIPTLTRTELRSVTHDCLRAHELKLSDIDEFVCHPGGAKVLDALEDAFELQRGGLGTSRRAVASSGQIS